MTNLELAQGLRAVADFYEQNPEAIQPYPNLIATTYERQRYIDTLKMMAHGGRVEKKVDGDGDILENHHAIRDFGGIKLDVRIPKNMVCRKVRKLVMTDTYECPDSLLDPEVN
jgi:hypothetical protein